MISLIDKSRLLAAAVPIVSVLLCSGDERAAVRVAPMDSVGPRTVEEQTRTSVVRDYLNAWRAMDSAFSGNRPDLLNQYFVGLAKDRLAETIREQQSLGIETGYRDLSHTIQAIFYSPEGLSLQLLDEVEYDIEVSDHGKTLSTQHVKTRYVAVLTPAESKWKVRIFQGGG